MFDNGDEIYVVKWPLDLDLLCNVIIYRSYSWALQVTYMYASTEMLTNCCLIREVLKYEGWKNERRKMFEWFSLCFESLKAPWNPDSYSIENNLFSFQLTISESVSAKCWCNVSNNMNKSPLKWLFNNMK